MAAAAPASRADELGETDILLFYVRSLGSPKPPADGENTEGELPSVRKRLSGGCWRGGEKSPHEGVRAVREPEGPLGLINQITK